MQQMIRNYSNLRSFIGNPVSFLDGVYSEGEKIKKMRIGPGEFILIFCPEKAREVLLDKSGSYRQNRNIFKKIIPLTGANGLVQQNGYKSKISRLSARSIFSNKAISRSKGIIEKNCDSVFSKMKSNQFVDPLKIMTELVLRNALEVFLGVEDREFQKEIGIVFLELHILCGQRMLNPFSLPLKIPTKKNMRILALSKLLKSKIQKHIKRQRIFPEGSILFSFKDDEHLVDHCMTFLFAGHETTASSLAFSLLLLAKNNQYQNIESIRNDDYLLSLYKESLRLYPPAYILVREVQCDNYLGEIPLKKGDHLIIGLKQILNSQSYFQSAGCFKPKRFMVKDREIDKLFFPFGLGAKSCIGEHLAYIEAKIILKNFLKRFEVSTQDPEIKFSPMVTLHPDSGQMIKLKGRTDVR